MTLDDQYASETGNVTISIRAQPGTAPGTLIVDEKAPPTAFRVFRIEPNRITESEGDAADLPEVEGGDVVIWLDVCGLGDAHVLQAIGQGYGLHRLALEDVVNVHQRPKCEEFGDGELFVVTRIPTRGSDSEQVSLYFGAGFLISFHETSTLHLEPVRDRLRIGKGKLRSGGADYVGYAILDVITDSFYPVFEGFGERLETLEEEALERPTLETLARIRAIKRDLMVLRRSLWPMREMFNAMQRETVAAVQPATRVYLRDCYDHVVQLIDIADNCRELASGLMDVYLSSNGNRMNEIMKVLTIVSTIFIPLTFVAGIYGMNFDSGKSSYNMPELAWRFGYPLCLLIMLILAAAMVVYFRRLGWLGGTSRS